MALTGCVFSQVGLELQTLFPNKRIGTYQKMWDICKHFLQLLIGLLSVHQETQSRISFVGKLRKQEL